MGKPQLPWTTCIKCGGLKVRRKHGSGWWCPPCKWEYTAGSRARWKAAKPTRWRVYQLKMKCRKYGIEPELWVVTWHKQNGRCRGCLKKMVEPHIDHCHVTNKFRGLLCSACNLGIGNFKENIENIRRIYEYLLESET